MRRPAALGAVTLLAALAPAADTMAAAPIMPLADLEAGMRCTALSVVKGTTISSFDVMVEDVVAGDPAQRTPRILVRVSGPAVDATGVGQGFSGSPISCPGADGEPRVAGAISESLGEYGGRVALATPIEAILGEPVDPPPGARSAPALLRAARPIATPLTVGGLATPVAAALRRAVAKRGRVMVSAPGRPRAGIDPGPLRPGSAMAAGLASGDVTLSAVGTATYVDGDRVWGFGHPLDSVGRRGLFLQDAYVYTVVNNPVATEEAQTYKLAAPVHDVGTVGGDGLNAVTGRLGALPASFGMRVVARDLDTGRLETTSVQLADEGVVGLPAGQSALGTVGPAAVAQAAYTILGGAPVRQSGSMCARFAVRERRRPLRFCNDYVGGGGGSIDLAGAPLVADFAEAAALIDGYDAGPLHVTGVEVNVKLRRGLRQAFLVRIRGPRTVRLGSRVRLRVTLRHVRGRTFTRTVTVRVPRGMPRGERQLTLTGVPSDALGVPGESGDGDIDVTDLLDPAGEEGEGPTSLDALADAVAAIHREDAVTASFREPGSEDVALDELEAPDGAEGVALRERPVLRDPRSRVSGSAALRVTVEP